jgi:hypothetical protein
MTAQTNVGSEISHRIGTTGRFVLRVPSGDVTITATDSEIATVRDRTGRNLSDRFEIGARDGELEVVARQRFGITFAIGSHEWGSGSGDLDVEVPARAGVVVDTASGEVSTTGLIGPKRFRTASGDLAFSRTAGELELDAVSGDVQIDAVGVLDVRGKTISGDLHVRAPRCSRFDMATTSGDIWLDAELTGKGPFSIKSISGDVLLVSRGDLQVEAQTITGDLVSQVTHRRESVPGRKLLIIGRGGPTLAFKSVSGDLQIVEAREQQVEDAMTDIDFTDRAGDSEPTTGSPAADPDRAENVRLEILRALERGEIDVETAHERRAAREDA